MAIFEISQKLCTLWKHLCWCIVIFKASSPMLWIHKIDGGESLSISLETQKASSSKSGFYIFQPRHSLYLSNKTSISLQVLQASWVFGVGYLGNWNSGKVFLSADTTITPDVDSPFFTHKPMYQLEQSMSKQKLVTLVQGSHCWAEKESWISCQLAYICKNVMSDDQCLSVCTYSYETLTSKQGHKKRLF